jgi:hypothetical protein
LSKKRRKLSEPPTPGTILDVVGVGESDRGCVLAAHGHLDGLLEELVRAKLRVKSGETDGLLDWLLTEGQQPPLQSFYVKLVMVRVLSLIDEHTFSALVKLNALRNHFAHYPGKVTLTVERAQAIYDLMREDTKKYSEFYQKMGFWNPMMNRRTPARKLFARVFLSLADILEQVTCQAEEASMGVSRHNAMHVPPDYEDA